jgi:1-deoxy-D-xylulose-5-phosphate synthase
MGGAGSAVGECLAAHGITTPIYHLGLPDHFVEQGSREEILALCGLDKDGIIRAVLEQAQVSPCQTAATHVNS